MRYSLLATLLLLSACGQAGDLYLPSQPSAHPAAQPAPPPTDDKKKDAH